MCFVVVVVVVVSVGTLSFVVAFVVAQVSYFGPCQDFVASAAEVGSSFVEKLPKKLVARIN